MWKWTYKGRSQEVSDENYQKMKNDVAWQKATWHYLGPGPLDQATAQKKAELPKVNPPAESAEKKA